MDRTFFADTGGEKPETYTHVELMSEWLSSRGYPAIDTVRYRPVRAPYSTLEGNCLSNETLPSLAFGGRRRSACSQKFKVKPIQQRILGVRRGPNRCDPLPEMVAARDRGLRPICVLGYDLDEVTRGRGRRMGKLILKDQHFDYLYPLADWGWRREDCTREIVQAGVPLPIKSACFFCPASKPWELLWLAAHHPNLFLRALEIETSAIEGKHGLRSVSGLGGHVSRPEIRNWRQWAERTGVLVDGRVSTDREWLLRESELSRNADAAVTRPCQLQLFPAA